ncbi:MAG: type II secretion system protein GspH [endosymbiont of Galathealinum brachiosum]|uniref:Type II secretion system protein H n=1 Tax=endosymbiont of Galathealinum brachiosum TaxID=2200906 RepID=A0A370DBY5_9GAMM|nr:MAG: type II secretion system protein GspH [endosymbiont of Galathealinum brachiosum]
MFRNFVYRPNNQHQGFTLIELLVVIVIISISIGFVVVNISSGSKEELAEEEILRLQQILRFAHEQSVIRSEEYGVRFYETGYRFMRFNEENDNWIDINKDRLLRSRMLPEPLELDLYIEQIPVDILESQKDDPEIKQPAEEENALASAASNIDNNKLPEEEQIKPQIFLLSSSELTPQFEVRLRIPGSEIEEHLEGLPQGEYKRVSPDE